MGNSENLDREIYDELLGMRESYEKWIKEEEKKLEYYQHMLEKANRLIEVYQKRTESI
jgi:hypothetical protein